MRRWLVWDPICMYYMSQTGVSWCCQGPSDDPWSWHTVDSMQCSIWVNIWSAHSLLWNLLVLISHILYLLYFARYDKTVVAVAQANLLWDIHHDAFILFTWLYIYQHHTSWAIYSIPFSKNILDWNCKGIPCAQPSLRYPTDFSIHDSLHLDEKPQVWL